MKVIHSIQYTVDTEPGQGVDRREGCPVRSMYRRDGDLASSFYYKAYRSSDNGITTSVSPALKVAGRGRGGEKREEVRAVFSFPLLLISSHIMKGGQFDIFALGTKWSCPSTE